MKFSVIVPTCNRISSLERTLESLFRQTYQDAEIIVVNDGSTDGTDAILGRLASAKKIIYLRQENRGPAAARNAGAAIAGGEYLAFTDDDCAVPKDWLERFSAAFISSGADCIGGVVNNCIEHNIFSGLSQEMTNYFVVKMEELNRYSSFLTSNNIAYRATAFRNTGGFDERFRRAGGEERALNSALIANGCTTALARDIVIEHYHTLNLFSFSRQHRNYGRGAYILNSIVKNEMKSGSQSIPLSVYGSFIGSLFKPNPLKGIVKLFLVVLAQSMAAIGYFLQMFSSNR